MNIVFTGDIFLTQQFGGISRYFVELAREFVTSKIGNVRFESPIYTNVHLHEHKKFLNHRGIYFRRDFRGLKRLCRLLASTLDSNADIRHETYYRYQNLRRGTGVKVCTFYDMLHERFGDGKDLIMRKKLAFESCDRCIAISEATKIDLVEYLNVAPEKISVTHLAATPHAPVFTPKMQKLNVADGHPYLLWVGPRGWYKNFSRFSIAFAASKCKVDKWKIVCAGGPNLTQEEVAEWCAIGLDPDLILHCVPNDAELAWLYSNAQFLVYASLYEGFGIPPLEAMQYGCAVATSNAGSIPEVVGEAASLFDPKNSDSILHSIDSLYESSALRNTLSELGKEQAKKFSWKKCAEQTLEIYRGG